MNTNICKGHQTFSPHSLFHSRFPPPVAFPKEGMPYNFAYAVKDDYAGSDFGAQENSDGNTVRGSYTVALPDGRKQTVSERTCSTASGNTETKEVRSRAII